MPLIDKTKTNFKVTYSYEETDLRRDVDGLIRKNHKKFTYRIGKESISKKSGLVSQTFPATLESARLFKKLFKGKYTYELTERYKAFVTGLNEKEKEFKRVCGITDKIKRQPIDELGFVDKDGLYNIGEYKFKTMPRNHQKQGFCLLVANGSFMVNWDMRLGKTFVVANYMQYLNLHTRHTTTLVLAPKRIRESTWIRDVYLHTDMEGLAVVNNLNAQRIKCMSRGNITLPMDDGRYKEFKGTPEYYVLNHDAPRSPKILDYIINVMKPDNLVIDESHEYKNPTAARSEAVMKISKYIHSKGGNIVTMSGTQFGNDITDGYSVPTITTPNMFPYPVKEYIRRYCITEDNNRGGRHSNPIITGSKNLRHYRKRYLGRSQRIEIQDCHDMPKTVHTIHNVELSDEQRKHFTELKNKLITILPDNSDSLEIAVLNKMAKLTQITGGYIYSKDKRVVEFKENTKLIELDKLLHQILSNDKNNVVVFSNYIPALDILRKYLGKSQWEYTELNSRSKDQIGDFTFMQDPKKRIILAQPSLVLGKNLSKANYAIFYDNNFKMIHREQANSRIFTPESLAHGTVVTIDMVANNTFDYFIYERITAKKEFNNAITKEFLKSIYK